MKTKTINHNRICSKNTIIIVISAALALYIQSAALACPEAQVEDPVVSSGFESYFNPQASFCDGYDCMQNCDISWASGTDTEYQLINGAWVYCGSGDDNDISQAVNEGACIEG